MTMNMYDSTHMHQPSLEAYALIKQINAMLEIFNRYDLRGEDLTVPQFTILNHIRPEGVPLSEISARMLCDNSNLTGIVDRLIAKGLVERRPDPQDRRVSLICLTDAGTEKLRSIRPRHQASVNQRMRALPEADVQQLRDLLKTLHSGLAHVLQSERNDTNGKETPASTTSLDMKSRVKHRPESVGTARRFAQRKNTQHDRQDRAS
jgi:DNA-binding MarR family transcriptional regulator